MRAANEALSNRSCLLAARENLKNGIFRVCSINTGDFRELACIFLSSIFLSFRDHRKRGASRLTAINANRRESTQQKEERATAAPFLTERLMTEI
jgi:hypothetical protein